MLYVNWPSAVATEAEVWRVLDLSGMTRSVRESRNFTLAGFVYLNGNKVSGLKDKVYVGAVFTLELRFPDGFTKSQKIFLRAMPKIKNPRQNSPFVVNRRS
jgi:hypothetical protein